MGGRERERGRGKRERQWGGERKRNDLLVL